MHEKKIRHVNTQKKVFRMENFRIFFALKINLIALFLQLLFKFDFKKLLNYETKVFKF